jgi:hypothetical protein
MKRATKHLILDVSRNVLPSLIFIILDFIEANDGNGNGNHDCITNHNKNANDEIVLDIRNDARNGYIPLPNGDYPMSDGDYDDDYML